VVAPARTLFDQLNEQILRNGSIRFDEYMELALYHRSDGFFSTSGGAGRSGADFLTSPEVGPLFGAVMAQYLDARWRELGCPDPFVVVEAAAGRGALALAVRAAEPACAAALRYVLVERSESLRLRQREHLRLVEPNEVFGPAAGEDAESLAVQQSSGPLFCSLEDLPAEAVTGVVIANELLDNIPVRILQRDQTAWLELRVTLEETEFVELLVPADPATSRLADELLPQAAQGVRIPLQALAVDWLHQARSLLRAGSVLVIDYCASSEALSERPYSEWLRTYRAQERGQPPLKRPGSQDITCELAVDQLQRVAPVTVQATQADWLKRWGIEDLVREGRQIWKDGASKGSIAAVRGRSRVVEAEALLDPAGLGAFQVLEWRVGSC
jgi:SAM-dependent MidA family methyltransferase